MFLYNMIHRCLHIQYNTTLYTLYNIHRCTMNYMFPYRLSYIVLYIFLHTIVCNHQYMNLYNLRCNPYNLSHQNLSYWNRRC